MQVVNNRVLFIEGSSLITKIVLIFRNYVESQILWFAQDLKITDTLRVSYKKRSCQNLCYLAKTTSPIISIASTDIVFLTKMQKRQTLKYRFTFLENDITGSEPTVKMLDT